MIPKLTISIALMFVISLAGPALADSDSSKSSSSTTNNIKNRSDDLSRGDKIYLQSDTQIFTVVNDDGSASNKKACIPAGSKLAVVTAPEMTTKTTPPDKGAASSKQETTNKGTTTTVHLSAATEGDATIETSKTASAKLLRAGSFDTRKVTSRSDSAQSCGPGASKTSVQGSSGSNEQSKSDKQSSEPPSPAVEGKIYSFSPADLDKFDYVRYGFTYGALVVPTKVIIADRSFMSSTSLLPYVGWKGWLPWGSTAAVFGAGVGTAPSSSQTSTTSSSTSSSTKATFSVATGGISTFGTNNFRAGILIGVDTAGSRTGFKYQGKPWIGVTLGAGSQ